MPLRLTCLVLALLILGASGCSRLRSGQPAGTRDDLLGWYEIDQFKTVIPVLKIDGAYYTVCRGVEAPLKECPNGLEWALAPSSMQGTRILRGEKPGTFDLILRDTRSQSQNEFFRMGQRFPLKRIEKPAEVPATTAPRPRASADFAGWYQPVYFPLMRFEIRKYDEKYVSMEQYFDGQWKTAPMVHEIVPLPDGSGFGVASDPAKPGNSPYQGNTFIYNAKLKRYETTDSDQKREPALIRVPLVRINPPTEKDPPPSSLNIGIPSWN